MALISTVSRGGWIRKFAVQSTIVSFATWKDVPSLKFSSSVCPPPEISMVMAGNSETRFVDVVLYVTVTVSGPSHVFPVADQVSSVFGIKYCTYNPGSSSQL